MGAKYNNWERFYQKLNMIFHGIIASSLIPFAWVFLETQKEFPEGPLVEGTNATILKTLLVIGCAALLAYSRAFRQKVLKKMRSIETMENKLRPYLSIKSKHYALIESVAILSLVGLYLTKDHLFTAVYVIVLFMFSLERPAFDRVARELNVKEKDLHDWAAGQSEE